MAIAPNFSLSGPVFTTTRRDREIRGWAKVGRPNEFLRCFKAGVLRAENPGPKHLIHVLYYISFVGFYYILAGRSNYKDL